MADTEVTDEGGVTEDALSGIDPECLEGRHPGVRQIARYFEYGHLQPPLSDLAREYTIFVERVLEMVGDSPELTVAIRKLLESKDAAVRALLPRTGLGLRRAPMDMPEGVTERNAHERNRELARQRQAREAARRQAS